MITEVVTETPGNIWKVLVKVGDKVNANDTLFIMEIMKTEVPHYSPIEGTIKEINITEGQEDVDANFVAIVLE